MSDFDKVVQSKEEGNSLKDIAGLFGFSYDKVSSIVCAYKAGYSLLIDHEDMLARRKGHDGFQDYRDSLARKDGFLNFHDKLRCGRIMGREVGFGRDDFFEMRAKEFGLSGRVEYFTHFDDLVNDVDAYKFLKKHGHSVVGDELLQRRFEDRMESFSYSQNEVLQDEVPQYVPLSDENMEKIDDFLDSLDHVDSYLINQKYYHGLTLREIASLTDVEFQAIDSRLRQIIKRAKSGEKKKKTKHKTKIKIPESF